VAQESPNQLKQLDSASTTRFNCMLCCGVIGIIGAENDCRRVGLVCEKDWRRKTVSRIDALDSTIAVFDDIEIFVAATATKDVCAFVALLLGGEFIEFLLSESSFKDSTNVERASVDLTALSANIQVCMKPNLTMLPNLLQRVYPHPSNHRS
jgi:hypothetical protein